MADLTEEDARARYHSPMSEAQLGESWMALRREMKIHRFCERTGLARDQVAVVVNARTKNAFVQWIGAVPASMRVEVNL